ncbi:MAG TPA: phosphatase PAP2 family protein [Polyangia bacterium]|jgi:hypothetical protein
MTELPPESPAVEVIAERAWFRPVFALAPHEHVLLLYMAIMLAGLALAAPSAERNRLIQTVLAILLGFGTVTVVARGVRQPSWTVRAVFRLAPITGLFLVYANLRTLIPTIHPVLLDIPLYHFDLAVFRFEPALACERFLTPFLVNWLSAWYSLYWLLLAVFVLPQIFLRVDPRRAVRLGTAVIALTCIAHVLYIVVPGLGPVVGLKDQFAGPLPRGWAYDFMIAVASGAGPQRDIFPSLHTAHTLLFTLICWHERESTLYRWARWPMVAITAHMIAATMALRWHYGIDVIVGAALAYATFKLAHVVNPWWERKRTSLGLSPTWW